MCGCTGSCSCSSTRLPIGPTGTTGADGDQGLYGGFSSDWVFSTSTGSGPASTNIRLNSATYASVTSIYISNVNAAALDLTAFLVSFGNGGNFGYVRLFKQSDNTKYWYGRITAVTNNTSEIVLTVVYIDSNDTFAASDSVVVTFSPSGATTAPVLYNNTTDVATSGAGSDALMSYAIAANTLKTDGDQLEIDCSFTMSATTESKLLHFTLNGGVLNTIAATGLVVAKGTKYIKGKITITRKSATAVYVTVDFNNTDTSYLSSRDYHFNVGTGAGFAVSDLTSNTLTIACFGENNDAVSNVETITQNQLEVKYFNK